jgi:hypothetical protein
VWPVQAVTCVSAVQAATAPWQALNQSKKWPVSLVGKRKQLSK